MISWQLSKLKECFVGLLCHKVLKRNTLMSAESVNAKVLVILLDDEASVLEGFRGMFQDLGIDIELRECGSPKAYESIIDDLDVRRRLRALILDLSNTPEEATTRQYKAAEYIQKEYEQNRIPIFIHSGNLAYYSDLQDRGTVFRIEKSKESIESICKSIQLMLESNFLNIFCSGGLLEAKIMHELHNAFVGQFKNREIEEIIKSIQTVHKNKFAERTGEVFERTAIRAVYENWVSAKQLDGESYAEVKLNAIEHYYRRSSEYKYWTGDIFRRKQDKTLCMVVSPRCNLAHNNLDELLLCRIDGIDEKKMEEFLNTKKGKEAEETKGQQKLRKTIVDDLTQTGARFRFLPPTPQFEGGFVDCSRTFSMKPDEFLSEYELAITLSDELTNDVVRKLGSYLLRSGISETDFQEAHHYLSMLKSATDEANEAQTATPKTQ